MSLELAGVPFPEELQARYRPRRLLGAGAHGAVFLAEDLELERQVAVKVLLGEPGGTRARRVVQEGRVLSGIDHPGVLRVYQAGSSRRGPYLITEYLPGGSLDQAPPVDDPLGLMLQVADALEAVHGAGILHRDVKPANIALGEGGRPVLVDFGLARGGDSTNLTETGAVVGTMGFLAPEVLRGAEHSVQSDWYSWAATLYFLLERRMPYQLPEIMGAVAGRPLPPARFTRVSPDSIDARLVGRLLALDDWARPTSRAELDELLLAPPPSRPLSRSMGRTTLSRAMRRQRRPASAVDERARRSLHPVAASLAVGLGIAAALHHAGSTPRLGAGPALQLGGVAEGVPAGDRRAGGVGAGLPPPVLDATPGPGPSGAGPTGAAWAEVPGGRLSRPKNVLYGPPLRLDVPAFRLATREVTVGEYADYLAATGAAPPPRWDAQRLEPSRPVVEVSWTDAARYATWAGARLPTWPEWDLAARGLDGRRWAWGDEAPDPSRAVLAGEGAARPAEHVDRYLRPAHEAPRGGAAPGLQGMEGNVSEWCAGPSLRIHQRDLPAGRVRVVAGGSWRTTPQQAQAEREGVADLEARRPDLGLRLAAPRAGQRLKVRLEVYPRGAEVFDVMEGRYLGQATPTLEVEVAPGPVILWLQAPGYLGAQVVATGQAGRALNIERALTPRAAALRRAVARGLAPPRPRLPDLGSWPELGGAPATLAAGGGAAVVGTAGGRVLALEPGRARELARHPGGVLATAVGPGGRWAASAGADHAVWIHDLTGATPPRVVSGLPSSVFALDFHPTQPWLFTGDFSGRVRRLSLDGGSTTRDGPRFEGPIWALDVQGDQLLAAGFKGWVHRLDARDLEVRAGTPVVEGLGIRGLVEGRGATVLASTEDGAVWQLPRDGAPRLRIRTRPARHGLYALPDGHWLAVGRGVLVVHGPGGEVGRVELPEPPRCLAVEASGRTALVGIGTAVLRVELPGPARAPRLEPEVGPVQGLAWEAGEGGALQAGGLLVVGMEGGLVRFPADLGGGPTRPRGPAERARGAVAVGPGGALAWGLEGGGVATRAGWRLPVAERPAPEVHDLAFSPTGRLWVACKDRALRGLDGPRLAATAPGHEDWVACLAGPLGGRLASGGYDGRVALRDPDSGAVRTQLPPRPQAVKALALLARGGVAVSMRGRPLEVWTPGAEVPRLLRIPGALEGGPLASTPDGRRLVLAGHGGAVLLVDPEAGEVLERFHGHGEEVSALAVEPGSARLASGSWGGDVRVWRLPP